MGKVAQNSVKYVVEAKLQSTGMVEKPDVVGAIFGQTEGLLGEELDLRELQERGRVGRIDVHVEDKNGSSTAKIKIPTSLDATETALLGAALETIERVGPTNADIRVKEIRDERTSKRDYIVKRAKQLLKDIQTEKPEKGQITDEVKEEVRATEITEYKGFEAGPGVEYAGDIILVEGRADLLNLLRCGVKNGVALGGTSIPEKILEIVEDKEVTAFLDGDRGGDLILKELKDKTEVDYIARAPENKEVEELEKEQVYTALRDKNPAKFSDSEAEKEELDEETRDIFVDCLEQLVGTRAVHILDENHDTVERIPLKDFNKSIGENDKGWAVLFDAKIDNTLVTAAEKLGAKYVVGMGRTGNANSSKLEMITRTELEEKKVKH